MKATAEYATAKIEVWWDMRHCPIPEGHDAGRVRPVLEGEFKKRGYCGPVSITAYGDQTQTPGHILQELFSTGVSVAHTVTESINYMMHRDMVEWRDENPPPAIMMIISDEAVQGEFDWDLLRLQQRTRYNLFLAYSVKRSKIGINLETSDAWCWESLISTELSGPYFVQSANLYCNLYCKSCNFDSQSLKKFKKHLWSYQHIREEHINPTYNKIVCETEDWGKNYKATPEFATAKIQVWWNMDSCPIPEGYDARQIRPSIEAAFKELGYFGPVSITAYHDHKDTPLEALSSTGVHCIHIVPGFTGMCTEIWEWDDANPPQAAAIMMVISDYVESMTHTLLCLLQTCNYKLFLAYSYRPCKTSFFLTSGEWLWESLLAGSEKTRPLLEKCSSEGSEEKGLILPKCSSEIERFYCRLCDFGTKSINEFRSHLSTDEHDEEEKEHDASLKYKSKEARRDLVADYNQRFCHDVNNHSKTKRMKKRKRKASPG